MKSCIEIIAGDKREKRGKLEKRYEERKYYKYWREGRGDLKTGEYWEKLE